MRLILLLILTLSLGQRTTEYAVDEELFYWFEANRSEHLIRMHHLDTAGVNFGSIRAIRNWYDSQGEDLLMAMNGGIYMEDGRPLGLYIENGQIIKRLNEVNEAYGNFYLQPNGVFYIDKTGNAHVRQRASIPPLDEMRYATQSGPMLLIDGMYHPALNQGSKNKLVRNAVGVKANGSVLFVQTKEAVNFYDLATFFKQKGCTNALYLDGVVSRTFMPSAGIEQNGGKFGLIISVTDRL